MMKMFNRLIVLSAILLGLAHGLTAQSPARLRCLEVLGNGDVMVHWIREEIGTGAYSYVLFHSPTLGGPYNRLDSITVLSQGSYLHSGAGAHIAPQYYHMFIYRLNGKSASSDTLQTMLLQGSTNDFEVISLNWTPLHVPLMPYMHPWYLLFREYPPGNWQAVDSTQGLSIDHHFWNCNPDKDTVRFRIGVRVEEFLLQCHSFSNPVGVVLENRTNRFPPAIDSVSIGPDGKAVIGWQPGTEPDILGYKIFRVTGTNDSIDYVAGQSSSYYVHQDSDPCSGTFRYIILSVDSCGNESPFPFDPVTLLDQPHSTIYLREVSYDPCLMTNTLTWNEYENFSPPLGVTRIFVSENGGPEQVLASIPPGQSGFVHQGLNPNTIYSYYVRAYSQDGLKTSTSCRREVRTYNAPSPSFMYLITATVTQTLGVQIIFYTDTAAHVRDFRIMRSESESGPFEEIGTVENSGHEEISYFDATADFNSRSYYYQVEVTDSCGTRLMIANTARSIFLTVEANDQLENVLSWNDYEFWDGGVAGYNIQRRLNDDITWYQLGQTPVGLTTYTDNVAGLSGNAARIRYRIVAFEGGTNQYGYESSSFSNEVTAEQESKFFVPNAIAPKGLNQVLKPVAFFVGSEGYEFFIYNRWGQQIFFTADPEQGWDGRFKGKYVEQGVYVYLIRYRDTLGEVRLQKGNVAVIY